MTTFVYIILGLYLLGSSLSVVTLRRILKKQGKMRRGEFECVGLLLLVGVFSWLGFVSVVIAHYLNLNEEQADEKNKTFRVDD